MSFFDPRIPRYSKQHLSRTNPSNLQPRPENEDAEIAPDDGTGNHAQPKETPQQTQPTSVPVAPIRSLSIRQQPRYPSSAQICSTDNHQAQSDRDLQRTASGTITRTIQKLEDLLGELDHMAHEAEDISSNRDPPGFRRASTRLSPGIRLRAASLPLEQPITAPKMPKHIGGTFDRRVSFSESESPRTQATHHGHLPDGIRPCNPVHLRKTPYKAAAAPAELTGPDQDFELKLLRRRSQSESRFHEHFKLNPPIQRTATPEEGYGQLTSKRPSETRISMSRKNFKRRVRANQPPPVLPRTTSIRESSHEDDSHETFPVGLPPDLKVHEPEPLPGHERHYTQIFGINSRQNSIELAHPPIGNIPKIDLRRQRHVDVPGNSQSLDLHQICQHAPVARDWPVSRKRFAAIIACLNAACIGMVIGIYSGEVPAIQYVIVDFHHYTILGNVFLYSAMAIPTLLLWPLPLLHGRKVYTVTGFAVAMCLQIPQAVAVSDYRSPDVASYRELLFLSRALSGFAFGFIVLNIQGTLLDCFGASLQSHQPHEEALDPYDVRRHGGGMGVWLGIWSFASLASISLGFMIGAFIINYNPNVMWGFWTCCILLLVMLLLNVIMPEVRRSAYRRTLTEMRGNEGHFSRVTRGEVKMHLESTGPYWWGEEVLAGMKMSWLMVKQPGFLVLAIYTAWVYAQFTLILMLLGALASRYYMFKPIQVGLCVLALTLGALFAVPFEKASWLSRARYRPPRTDSMTVGKGFTWSSHMLRRIIFTVLLPLAALASTLTSKGPPMPVAVPCLFAAMVGFMSTLAMAECFGLIMETFDTSDLQPGMTGRPARRSVVARYSRQRTNFSCYPRVSAGYAVTQSLMFILAATATGLCGRLEQRLGAMVATGCVSATLLFLTLLLTIVLTRFKKVKMIPDRKPQTRTGSEDKWEPVILGTPSGTSRMISILEAGRQTRWSEIRRRNKLDEEGLTGS